MSHAGSKPPRCVLPKWQRPCAVWLAERLVATPLCWRELFCMPTRSFRMFNFCHRSSSLCCQLQLNAWWVFTCPKRKITTHSRKFIILRKCSFSYFIVVAVHEVKLLSVSYRRTLSGSVSGSGSSYSGSSSRSRSSSNSLSHSRAGSRKSRCLF